MQVWIAVAQRLVGIDREGVDEIAQQFRRRWRAHPDRERQAGILGNAVARHAGRQVQHVAGAEQPVVAGMKLAQQLEFDVVAELQRWCIACKGR